MEVPLTISSMLERAETFFPEKGVVSRTLSKIHRLSYKKIRTRSLASSLGKFGKMGTKLRCLRGISTVILKPERQWKNY